MTNLHARLLITVHPFDWTTKFRVSLSCGDVEVLTAEVADIPTALAGVDNVLLAAATVRIVVCDRRTKLPEHVRRETAYGRTAELPQAVYVF